MDIKKTMLNYIDILLLVFRLYTPRIFCIKFLYIIFKWLLNIFNTELTSRCCFMYLNKMHILKGLTLFLSDKLRRNCNLVVIECSVMIVSIVETGCSSCLGLHGHTSFHGIFLWRK